MLPTVPASVDETLSAVSEIKDARQAILREIEKRIIGQRHVIDQLLIALFARGHCLFVGVPGLAKTLLISTLSEVLQLRFSRIQFTPDLMPSDITGTEVIQEDAATRERVFRFVQGPVFANLVLADEINRAPPKTQAALLEAMQEYQVTAAGRRYPLPPPFLVLATQNPIELEGTYPLPEAQLDRFMLSIHLDYPGEEEDLTGPRQDAAMFREVLISKYGFKEQNIVTLTDRNGSRDQIVNAFRRFLAQIGVAPIIVDFDQMTLLRPAGS